MSETDNLDRLLEDIDRRAAAADHPGAAALTG